MVCDECDSYITEKTAYWSNLSQQTLCKFCYDDITYYENHIDEFLDESDYHAE